MTKRPTSASAGTVRCLPAAPCMLKDLCLRPVFAACLLLASPALIHGNRDEQKPRFDNYQVPAGAALILELRTPLDSASSAVDAQVEATLRSPVIQDKIELIPANSMVIGKVSEVLRATARKPRGRIAFVFTIVEHAETSSLARIRTQEVVFEPAPEPAPERGRAWKPSKKPVDVVVPEGETFVAMLAEPLLVRIPK